MDNGGVMLCDYTESSKEENGKPAKCSTLSCSIVFKDTAKRINVCKNLPCRHHAWLQRQLK